MNLVESAADRCADAASSDANWHAGELLAGG
jgi:hypothetical protein